MNIPMVDAKGQYEKYQDEFESAIRSVFDSGQYILGPNVTAFEEEVARYCGVKHAVGVASGTDALHLALRAAGIQEGDEVITTAFTFIATAEAISYQNARPVFVDIDPDTFNIDVKAIESAITESTRAIVVVHLFGQSVDMEPVQALCKKHNLKLIEDCAQAFGADYHGKKVGSIGDFGCFSFYPSKNLGAYGDGGLITTNDDAYAESLRSLRNHGSFKQYQHSVVGFNSRLDEVQAAILRVKMKYIDDFNTNRRNNAHRYNEQLSSANLIVPVEHDYGTHVFHQYTIRSEKRDQIKQALMDQKIACAVYYPIPLHKQPVYEELCAGIELPASLEAAHTVLSLPMFPELTEQQIDIVCKTIIEHA